MYDKTAKEPERRRHQRTQLRMSLRCIRLDPDCGDVVETLHMTDISRSGLGAVCDRSFYPGQRIVLALPLSERNGRRSIYASIVRCRQGREGYHVGLQFDSASLGACAQAPAQVAAAA